jgi:outer membrane protein OmpA-like peptidoglycan-associated protein
MGAFVESADRPYLSRIAGEDVYVGELVAENGSDAFRRTDAANDSAVRYLATKPYTADYIAEDEDATSAFTYAAADNDRVPALPLSDGDLIRVRTPEDTGGNESAPSISDGDTVGVIDTSAGALSSTDEYKGRVVESGYTDGDGTATYNESNGNFIALGIAERDEADGWDDVFRVRVQR